MDIPATIPTPEAQAEFGQLIQTLHDQGLLRLANNLAASHAQWAATLTRIIDAAVERHTLQDATPALLEAVRLVQVLHQQGLLRLAADAAASHREWSHTLGSILDRSLGDTHVQTALQNARIAFETFLGRIDPEAFRKLLTAVTEGLARTAAFEANTARSVSPGLLGTLRLMKDEPLWQALAPILEGVRGFGAKLAEQPPSTAQRQN
ncbi:MAG: hypothetical protein EPN72_01905 [Nevskiaceae bacterium]|nr:MAG: hypothetical protein EPN63_12655 [Nevskiaceae bacterium]TBR74788.1 MAG: hypothetical protein EPN72_01905 [Nevskiaceae bacterium]